MNSQTLRNNLKGMLEEGATQTEIASAAGVTQNCLWRFLNEAGDISLSRAEKLMAVASGNSPIGSRGRSNTSAGDSEGED
jgi:hypothetical protein